MVERSGIVLLLDPDRKYTYKDYLTWPEDERWGIFDGVPYMQAVPTWHNKAASTELMSQFNGTI